MLLPLKLDREDRNVSIGRKVSIIQGVNDLKIYSLGHLNKKSPTLIYLALSGEESLSLDPFNQPALYASELGFSVISLTLPAHDPPYHKQDAMKNWALEFSKENNILEEFISKAKENIDDLLKKGYCSNLAVAGLSRGGFVGLHLAARVPQIEKVICYAPLINLEVLEEFQPLIKHPIVQSWNLSSYLDQLVGKKFYFSIGNRDQRVDTHTCFGFFEELVNISYQKGLRTPPVEMVLTPSIGFKGHGTSPSAFKSGIDWLKKNSCH